MRSSIGRCAEAAGSAFSTRPLLPRVMASRLLQSCAAPLASVPGRQGLQMELRYCQAALDQIVVMQGVTAARAVGG